MRGGLKWKLGSLAAVASILTLVLSAAAAAEVRSGSATDPQESSKPPGQDLIAVSAGYDSGGALSASITTAGAPTTPETFVAASFYNLNAAGECVTPIAVLGFAYGGSEAAWAYGSAEGAATVAISGNTVNLNVANPALATQGFGCATATTFEIEGSELGGEVDYLLRPFPLTAPPPPPPPPPPPRAPAPAPPKKASLVLAAPPTLTLKRNVWSKVKLPLTNSGTATAKKVTLQLGGARGVELKPGSGRIELKSIAAGKTKVASFRVRLGRKAKPTSRLAIEIKGKPKLRAKTKLTLLVKRKQKPSPAPKPGAGSLAETIFYGYTPVSSYESSDLLGYAFIDDQWAYTGIPTEGLPKCTEVTGNAKTEGCARYSYDAKTGRVKVGAVSGKVAGDTLEIDGETLQRLAIPKPGARFQVSQYYLSFSGYCGLITGCTTSRSDLTLARDGQFALSSSSLSTSGGSGPGETYVAVGNYPPDERGSYEVQRGARIRLAFADGQVETKTFGIMLGEDGRPDPVNVGLVLGGKYFSFAGDD